ncbi:MAG: nickel-dependent lactate racemase [Candidatus Eremiobacteraeota bacterium]|nr:nickel-dependent lactate racemase [Candidatus Eremiobacteraeota bacterium]
MKYEVFHGKKLATLDIPGKWDNVEIPMVNKAPLTNPENDIKTLLRNPTDSPPLSKLVKPSEQIAICVTDISRNSPDFILLPPLLVELEKAGIARQNITIIIGTGSHRDVTLEEMKTKYGYYASSNFRILNHNSRDSYQLRELGKTSSGAPIVLNMVLTMVDHIINVGVTDLHQYAGYSGGAKTIAVGCAGEETIQFTHSANFLEKSGAIPGNVNGNLFQDTLWEIVEPVPFDFSINVIVNEDGKILEIDAGKPRTVFDNMVVKAREIFEYEVDKGFDIAFLGVPYPKDINLYQATRPATYQALSDNPVMKRDGIINLICSCPEGIGKGVGEMRFKEKMLKFPNPAAILLSMSGKQTKPGEQRAFMVAQAMMKNKINIFGSSIPNKELLNMGFLAQSLIPFDMFNRDIRAVIMKDGSKKLLKLKS